MTALSNRERVEDSLPSQSRISREIEALRQRIADLESLEAELLRAERALGAAAAASEPAGADQIKSEIKKRLGYLPLFFLPVAENAEILQSFWQQSLAGYYDNPIPERFREMLFAQLARYCSAPYSIVTHSCKLHSLGASATEVLHILEQRTPTAEEDLDRIRGILARHPHPLAAWPDADSELEDVLLQCCVLFSLKPAESEQCRLELRQLLAPKDYLHLIGFLGYVKVFHLWIEAHPEISYHSDPQVRAHILTLLRAEPKLATVFRNYYQEYGVDRQRLKAEEALRASEERYRELFENAHDMVYTLDLEGNITSLNKAAERITGYARAEVLHRKLTDLVSPDSLETARKMMERQIAGENRATYELEILTKEGQRVALEISTHIISREGKPVGAQGIARDVTERKKTEEALQQTKENLEAWVHELEQRTREITLLNEMADMLRACLSTEEAYDVIVRVARQIFPGHAGGLYVITPSRNLVEAVAVWGGFAPDERVFASDECWGLRRGRVHWVEDTAAGLVCKHLHEPLPDGYLCVPMMAQSEALGVLYLTQPAHTRMTEAKRRLAMAMAEHIAMSLSNLKLHETLRSQSIRDPLTGLFNRRFMEESLDLELRRAIRSQRPLGVIMLDLDRFKHFNDTYGHEAGDTLLRELGSLLQTNIRAEDIACRYGGEEFTLILPEGNAEAIRQRAEALRDAIKRMEVLHRGQSLGRISASMGVAIFPEHGRTRDALLQAADAALYHSKGRGGDVVSMAK